MKKSLIVVLTSAAALLTGATGLMAAPSCCSTESSASAERASPNQLVLTSYDHVVKALAADNLDEAKNAARTLSVISSMGGKEELAEEARAMIDPSEIGEVRELFKKVSAAVVELAGEMEGYQIFICPGAGEDGVWVQTGETPRNPYMGAKSPECGRAVTAEELKESGEATI